MINNKETVGMGRNHRLPVAEYVEKKSVAFFRIMALQ